MVMFQSRNLAYTRRGGAANRISPMPHDILQNLPLGVLTHAHPAITLFVEVV